MLNQGCIAPEGADYCPGYNPLVSTIFLIIIIIFALIFRKISKKNVKNKQKTKVDFDESEDEELKQCKQNRKLEGQN